MTVVESGPITARLNASLLTTKEKDTQASIDEARERAQMLGMDSVFFRATHPNITEEAMTELIKQDEKEQEAKNLLVLKNAYEVQGPTPYNFTLFKRMWQRLSQWWRGS